MYRKTSLVGFISLVFTGLLLCLSTGISRAADDNIENLNTFELMTLAGAAQAGGKTDEAGFLFLASQARYQMDKLVYPPVGKCGDNPGVLKAALGSALGKPIIEAISGDAVAAEKVIAKLSKWSPKFADNHGPGWKHTKALDKNAAEKIAGDTCAKMLIPLRQKARLLRNEEYRKLMNSVGEAQQVERRYWAALEGTRGLGKVEGALAEEFRQATQKKIAASLRIQEITWKLNPESRWHATVGWKAEEYFEDPLAVKLCQAIEIDAVDEMERLIAQGADVNAKGKDGMTLLLWAFPDRKIERFACLLEHGADPNVYFESDFSVGHRPFHIYPENQKLFHDRGCHPGQSVTHLASRSPLIEYMQLVFANGGDVNLVDKKTKETPLNVVIRRGMPDMKDRARLLVEKGADVNRYSPWKGNYPAVRAIQIHSYDVAIFLLQSGADYNLKKPKDSRTLVHWVLMHEEHYPFASPSRNAGYTALVDWLKANNAPLDEARAYLDSKGRPWGKALRQQRDKQLAELEISNKLQAERRLKKLQEIKAADEEQPVSAVDLVKTLSVEQLKSVELPDEPEAIVLAIYRPASRLVSPDQHKPQLTAFANGRVVCSGNVSMNAKPVEGMITQEELTWLLHLAVNECGILSKDSKDYEKTKNHTGNGFYKYELAVKPGSNKLTLPQDTLVVRSLRRKLGLDKFKDLSTYVMKLSNQVHIGSDSDAAKILRAINSKLADEHPDLPPFRPHHLTLADHGEDSQIICTFNRVIDLGDKQFEDITAYYTIEENQPKIRFNVRRYSKG